VIVADQIAHQDIEDVVVDRHGFAETWHGHEFKPLYRLKDSNFVSRRSSGSGRWRPGHSTVPVP
jgi:hypothetical protein